MTCTINYIYWSEVCLTLNLRDLRHELDERQLALVKGNFDQHRKEFG